MITNKEIHELAENGYAQFRGPNHRIGYLVAWKRRKSDGSPLYCVFAGVESSHDVEWDSAGYFGKAFAVRLARKLVKDGYTGVYVQQVDAQTGSERDMVEFDAPAVPAVSPVPAVPAPVGVFDNLSETVPAETPEDVRVAEKLAERLQATASTLYGIPVVPSERARERAQRQADRNRRHYRAMRAWRKNL